LVPLKLRKQGADLLLGEYNGNPYGALCAHDPVHPRQLSCEHLAVKKEQRGEGLILGRGGNRALTRKVRQESGHLVGPHVRRVTLVMEVDEAPDPMQIGLLGPIAVVAPPNRVAQLIQQPARSWGVGRKALTPHRNFTV
jgi:hypothetical protein